LTLLFRQAVESGIEYIVKDGGSSTSCQRNGLPHFDAIGTFFSRPS
jgi:hypothetical protein